MLVKIKVLIQLYSQGRDEDLVWGYYFHSKSESIRSLPCKGPNGGTISP